MAAVSIQNITRSISQVFEAIYRKVIKTFAHHLSCLFCVSLSSPSTLFQFYRANPFTRILANLVRNYARLSWHNELPIDVLPESTLSTDGVGMRLREVLPKGLSPQEQEILLLRSEERLSYSEIADVLKIKEVSCRSRLMRAKAHLLNLYEKEKIL